MRLEIGTFTVNEVVFGESITFRNGVLEINKGTLIKEIREDPRVNTVDIDLAHPGESVRIWPVRDVIEPRIKVKGPGQCYPFICGRAADTVGEGTTHRLSGVGVVEVSDVPWHDAGGDEVGVFIDMCGPWSEKIAHLSSLQNVCVVVEPDSSLDVHTQNQVVHGACLRVADRLAAAVKGLTPLQTQVFDVSRKDPNLPNVMYIQCVHSPQAMAGSTRAFGTSTYGFSQLHAPWYLNPNEILDGALTGPYRTAFAISWVLQNNPLLLELYRRHGQEFNFNGVIVFRTEWTTQAEKQLMANQTAKLVKEMGAQGVVMTWDAGGNEIIEVLDILQSCERLGVKAVLMTSEDIPSIGSSPLLRPVKEADALVSTGIWLNQDPGVPTLPQVKKVIGNPRKTEGHLKQAIVATAGPQHFPWRYDDHYGLRQVSCDDF
jgi:glycine reductase